MSQPDLSPAPAWRTVWPTQLRMLSQLQKRDFVVLGIIVAVLSALAIYGIFRTQPPTNRSTETVMMFALLTIPFALVGAFWPLGVWRKESPERRGYFWSLPVPRGSHTLVRVGAGWVTLMAACIVMMVVTWVLLLVAELRLGSANLSFARWFVPLATATLAYLLISSLTVLLDSPVRTLAWIAVAILGLRIVGKVLMIKALAVPIDTLSSSLGKALAGPLAPHEGGPELAFNGSPYTASFATWGAHYLPWLAFAAAAIVLASFRYREIR